MSSSDLEAQRYALVLEEVREDELAVLAALEPYTTEAPWPRRPKCARVVPVADPKEDDVDAA